jgi:hypothetical protein
MTYSIQDITTWMNSEYLQPANLLLIILILATSPNEFEAEITQYAYLFLFLTSNNNGNVEIVFPGTTTSPKNYLYKDYKEDKLNVEIEAIRGRVKNKLFVKKIDDIVHDAKQIVS